MRWFGRKGVISDMYSMNIYISTFPRWRYVYTTSVCGTAEVYACTATKNKCYFPQKMGCQVRVPSSTMNLLDKPGLFWAWWIEFMKIALWRQCIKPHAVYRIRRGFHKLGYQLSFTPRMSTVQNSIPSFSKFSIDGICF